jgi:hypothetical protein
MHLNWKQGKHYLPNQISFMWREGIMTTSRLAFKDLKLISIRFSQGSQLWFHYLMYYKMRAGRVTQVIEQLPSKHEALSSYPHMIKKKR